MTDAVNELLPMLDKEGKIFFFGLADALIDARDGRMSVADVNCFHDAFRAGDTLELSAVLIRLGYLPVGFRFSEVSHDRQ